MAHATPVTSARQKHGGDTGEKAIAIGLIIFGSWVIIGNRE